MSYIGKANINKKTRQPNIYDEKLDWLVDIGLGWGGGGGQVASVCKSASAATNVKKEIGSCGKIRNLI